MDKLIVDNPQIQWWVYGHTHWRSHQTIGNTKVITNAIGYQDELQEDKKEDKYAKCISIY